MEENTTPSVENEESTNVEPTEEVVENVVDEGTPTDKATEKPEFLDSFEFQFNKENRKANSVDELKELAEMGTFYKEKGKKQLEDYKNDPRLKFVERQAKKNKMSTEEYLDAVAKEETNAEIAKIAEAEGVSETVAEKLYKATKLEEKTIADTKTAKEKEKQDGYMTEFVKEYPDVKEVPQEVWDRFNKGDISLVDAYSNTNMKSELTSLKEKLAKYEEQEKISNKNSENAGASTGSVTGNGTAEHLFTEAQVKKMSRAEVNKNYNKIIESQKQWK